MMRAHNKTLVLFGYDWDRIAFADLAHRWPQLHSGFDLFSFPSNVRLAWFDMQRFSRLAASKARLQGASAVVSNHEQFGALSAALVAEQMDWPGTSVEAVLACQHKLYARQVMQRVIPEANIPFRRLELDFGEEIPPGLDYPCFAKPVKAAFSVLARVMHNRQALQEHTRFNFQERWIIRHLVEPFERVIKQRLPAAGSAHSLMLEAVQAGPQYCLDGYCFDGKVHRLGVVDAIMYPGTNAFRRWDYPSQLAEPMQQQAESVARRFLQAIGFTHGFFNMEFIIDEPTGQVKVIEFNPRMAAQFSDLYQRVDGLNLHEMALAMSHGIDPASVATQPPSAAFATSFVYRQFDPTQNIAMPGKAQRASFNQTFPDGLLFTFPKTASQVARDFKWLGDYRYGIVHLGGDTAAELESRYLQASSILGWESASIPIAGVIEAT